MNIVIDTNVVVSAMFFGGKPHDLLQCVAHRDFVGVVSPEIVSEYAEVIERLAERYPNRPKKFPLESFLSFCECISPSRKISICRDPDDDKFLECASDAKCPYIVSGDDDLISIGAFEGIEIVTVAGFFKRFPNKEKSP